MRFRVIDWSTPWFWFVVFYRRDWGKPIVEANLFRPLSRVRGYWMLQGWAWEPEPDMRPAEAPPCLTS